jgi:hypothetical protein
MKRLIVFAFTFLILQLHSRADEGMWIPLLIGKNIADMQSKGFKLSAEDLYSANNSSIKDAVVMFGGGCTGEIISGQGLVLTNHHCGYGAIQRLSTVEKDYLMNGYAAMNKSEELPSAGLTVTLVVRIEDVTKRILDSLTSAMTEGERNKKIAEVSSAIEKDAIKETHYDARVRNFFYGNEFYLFVTETFKDIRLVVAPPSAIGNFGGETDNWVWPRHTGDFSLFRIYANKDNKPAEYSADNIPYTPKRYFTISMNGVKENDFAMVYGFPGRTTEYIPASAVDMIMNSTDPNRVAVRDLRLKIMDEGIHISDTVRLKYLPKYKGIANAYKKWQGELLGLKSFNGLPKKKTFETEFLKWTAKDENRFKKYSRTLHQLDSLYALARPMGRISDYTNEAAFGVEILGLSNAFSDLIELAKIDSVKKDEIEKSAENMKKRVEGFFKDYDQRVDQPMFAELLEIYRDSMETEHLPEYFKKMNKKFKGDMVRFSEYVFSKSVFATKEKLLEELTGFNKSSAKKLEKDVAYALAMAIDKNYDALTATLPEINSAIAIRMRDYMTAQREMYPERNFYPDANSTLRIAYGQVKGYRPNDGMSYVYRTTTNGIPEKFRTGNEEFYMPEKILSMIDKKDFGAYAMNDTLQVCFLTSSHTTGGNSGSPVINANGELIGTNFDRVWEGTMSDIMYSPDRCRNIAVDIRYTLWVIDKVQGAGYLVDEMKLSSHKM